jgi:NADH:ubiquinone oxidoreductase subunit 4 (subunit M)
VNAREMFTLVPLLVIVIVLGIYPSLLLNVMTPSINHLVECIAKGGAGLAVLP